MTLIDTNGVGGGLMLIGGVAVLATTLYLSNVAAS